MIKISYTWNSIDLVTQLFRRLDRSLFLLNHFLSILQSRGTPALLFVHSFFDGLIRKGHSEMMGKLTNRRNPTKYFLTIIYLYSFTLL